VKKPSGFLTVASPEDVACGCIRTIVADDQLGLALLEKLGIPKMSRRQGPDRLISLCAAKTSSDRLLATQFSKNNE
jgi:hypothetical protein